MKFKYTKEIIIAIVFLAIGFQIAPTYKAENNQLKKENNIQGQIIDLGEEKIWVLYQSRAILAEDMCPAIINFDFVEIDRLFLELDNLDAEIEKINNKNIGLQEQLKNLKLETK